MLIAVAGCVAQAEGREIIARQDAVDIVVGPQSYHRLPEMIARLAARAGHVLETEFPADEKFDALPEWARQSGPAAFLTVQEGCDKFCTFCVVPYTRGSEYSRPVAQIARGAAARRQWRARNHSAGAECKCLSGRGTRRGAWTLAQLLRDSPSIDGLATAALHDEPSARHADDLIAAHGELTC